MIVVLLVSAGAAARMTRLVTTDVITIPLRKAVIIRSRERGSRFFAFVEAWQRCPWCVGLWISVGTFAVALAAWLTGGLWLTGYVFAAAALTANLVWAMAAQRWDTDEPVGPI